ncbi:MAG: VOC family protein [Saprospiraceae bacterium]|jgi:PhnB protein|nr:VOC family protein [Saprospiraceae bacterium]
MEKPSIHQTVMPYLILTDVETFIAFTKQVFDAEELSRHPDAEGAIRHAEIKIGESTIMMGQSTGDYPPMPAGLFVYVKNADECYHKALEAGASSINELSDQEYGRTAGILDPCNNTWWITSVEHL